MFPKFMTPPNNNGYRIVIAGALVIADALVIAGLTRNPVVVQHWIPDQVRDDKLRFRDDSVFLCADHDLWKVQQLPEPARAGGR